MTQAYSDPSRESDPHALPDIQVMNSAHKGAESMTTATAKQAQRTPGPWHLWKCDDGTYDIVGPEGAYGDGAYAEEGVIYQNLPEPVARMVVAYPALVAALREMIDHAHHPDASKAHARVEQAEAALAAAGEQA